MTFSVDFVYLCFSFILKLPHFGRRLFVPCTAGVGDEQELFLVKQKFILRSSSVLLTQT